MPATAQPMKGAQAVGVLALALAD